MIKRKLNLVSKFVMILMMLAGLSFNGCSKTSPTQAEREKRILNSPQFRDGEFVNPIDVPMMAEGKTWDYIKRQFFASRVDPEPAGELPVKPINSEDWQNLDNGQLNFAWLGHSSILIAVDGKTILVDPVLEKRASPFSWVGPKRFHPTPVTAENLPPIDVVLITHDHYDHLEEPTIKMLGTKNTVFVVPLGIGEVIEGWGISPSQIKELDWWEAYELDTLSITATPALHYARRGVFDGNERLWCSFSIHGQSEKIFISGDSGYYDGFRQIGRKLGPFDLTFLKIGSYDETWKQIHMTAEEAVQQHQDVGGNILIPLHWATFDLGLHPWYEPIDRMMAAAGKKGVKYLTPEIGQQIDFEALPKTTLWWQRFVNSRD
jgi:L-ascorbate metabolism protein UlaG (beta-lactamase superfamily)